MIINTIDLLKGEHPKLRVKIKERLRKKLLNRNLLNRDQYSFKFNSFNLERLLLLGQKAKIDEDEILPNITDIKTRNHATWCNLPINILVNKEFVEGLAYYIGDGRLKTDRGLSTINSSIEIIKFFLNWLQKYFNADSKDIKTNIFLPYPNFNIMSEKRKWSKLLEANINFVKIKSGYKDHHKILIETYYYRTISKLVLDKIIPIIKMKCLSNKPFAEAYIRGIMAAEGSPKYNEKSHQRAIHLKMKDKIEVEYIFKLLEFLNFTPDLFFSRHDNEWIVSISGFYELKRLKEMNVFKLNIERRKKLERALSNYHHQQAKKGQVRIFYLTKLFEFERKHGKYCTAKELSKYIKRDKTRVIYVLRKLQKDRLLEGKRIIKVGRPFKFTSTKTGKEFISKKPLLAAQFY